MIVVRIQYKHRAQINSLPPVSSTGKILGPPDMTSRPLKDIVPVGKSSSSKSKSSASLLKVSKKPEDSRDDCMLAVDRQTDTDTPRVKVFRGIKRHPKAVGKTYFGSAWAQPGLYARGALVTGFRVG